VNDWISWILDSHSFVRRQACGGGWTDRLIIFYQLSNALISVAYFAIPLSLLALYFKIYKLKQFAKYNPWIILMFSLFIILCGITHLENVFVFYYPKYRLFAILDMLTALVSCVTAIALPLVVYELVRYLPEPPKIQSPSHTIQEIVNADADELGANTDQ
jgi:hypothetical protein